MTEQIHDGAGAEQLGEELREFPSALVSAAAPLVAQIAPGPEAPESSCTWCPVCALVALSRGEQHPLLTALGSRGVTLLTVLRDLIADSVDAHAQEGSAPHPGAQRATGPVHDAASGSAAASGGGTTGAAAGGTTGAAGGDGGADGRARSAGPLRFERIPVSVQAEAGGGRERPDSRDGPGRVP